MNTTLLLASMIAMATQIGGCGSSSSSSSTVGSAPASRPAAVDSRIADSIGAHMSINNMGPGRWRIGFEANGGGSPESPAMTRLRSIQSATFAVYRPDGSLIDSVSTTDIISSGVSTASPDGGSITAAAGVDWHTATPLPPGSFAIMTLYGDNWSSQLRERFPDAGVVPIPAPTSQILRLMLDGRERLGRMELSLTVKRLAAAPADEYLPTGEKFRLEIQNEQGEVVWSSSSGMVYTQAIGSVDPEGIGEEVTYKAMWDGRDEANHTAKAKPGRYTLIGTIPAKPNPYIVREELSWNGGQ